MAFGRLQVPGFRFTVQIRVQTVDLVHGKSLVSNRQMKLIVVMYARESCMIGMITFPDVQEK